MEQNAPPLPGFLRHHAFLLESTHRDFRRLLKLQRRLRAVLWHQKQREVSAEHIALTEDVLRGLSLAVVEPVDGSVKGYLRSARMTLKSARRTLYPAVVGSAVQTLDLGRISVRVNQTVHTSRDASHVVIDATLENIGNIPVNAYGLRFGKLFAPLHVLLPPSPTRLTWIRGAPKLRICFRTPATLFGADASGKTEWLLL